MVGGKGQLQVHDNRISRWLKLPELKKTCYSGCIHERKLEISCGSSYTAVFHPVANKWQEKSSNTKKLHDDKIVSYENRLWAVGDLQTYYSYGNIDHNLGIGVSDA